MREPAAFYVRSCDHLDVVADDPDCYLPTLPGAPATSEVVPIHSLDCAKDGLDDAALMVLVHEPGQLVSVRPGHITPGLATPVLADGVGFGPDARCHALGSYRVANLPCQVGRIQAEETSALFDPPQHRPQSCDVGGVPVGDQVVQDGLGGDIDDAVQLDPAALEPDLVVADAEPPDEPVAGVAGAVPGHRTGHHDVADDPRVDLTQVWLGDHAVGAPYGAL